MKTVAFLTLGCKVNTYESEAMLKLFCNAGYKEVDFKEQADVYVINTCTVTNTGDSKSRQMIRKAKRNNENAVIVVVGCYSQVASEEVKAIEGVNVVLGTQYRNQIIEFVDEYLKTGQQVVRVADVMRLRTFEDLDIDEFTKNTRAFLKIQDGCNNFCTYCIIPYARGRMRSRDKDSVLNQAQSLVDHGFVEIVLTGIHTAGYGADLDDYSFYDLLVDLTTKIKGLKRLRISSIEMSQVSDEIIDLIATSPVVVDHLHIPIQAGCNETLKRMNRHYTADEYYTGCEILRKYFKNPAITTDVIVGFAGETEEEFEATYKFLEDICFYEMHVFKYSKRQGTVAAARKDQVDDRLKTERSNRLLEMEQMQSSQYRKSYIGTSVEALMEEEKVIKGQKYQVGYTKTYVKVAVPTEESLGNQIFEGKAVELLDNEYLLLER